MTNRIANAIETVRASIRAGLKLDGSGPIDPDALESLDATLALTFEERYRFQDLQAEAHARGTLSTEEASVIYRALGEVGSSGNGGWASGTDLATKVVVTEAMRALLTASIRTRSEV